MKNRIMRSVIVLGMLAAGAPLVKADTIMADPTTTLTSALTTDFNTAATIGIGILVVVWAVMVVRKGLKLRG